MRTDLAGWLVAVLVGLGPALGAEPPAELRPQQRKELEDRSKALNQRAWELYQRGQYAPATDLLRQALAMRQKLYPRERYPQGHPLLAQSLNSLGSLLQAQGEYASAEPLVRDAVQMYQSQLQSTGKVTRPA